MILHFGRDSELIGEAISLIDTAFDVASASSFRTLLVSAVARHPENINDRPADFLFKHLDSLNQRELLDSTHELGRANWPSKPNESDRE
jgi:hypothetical protein